MSEFTPEMRATLEGMAATLPDTDWGKWANTCVYEALHEIDRLQHNEAIHWRVRGEQMEEICRLREMIKTHGT